MHEAAATFLRLQGLIVDNVSVGGHLLDQVRVVNCLFRSCEYGLACDANSGMRVRYCLFEDN